MKLEKNKEKTLQCRVSEEDYIKFVFMAKTCNLKPSKLLRMLVQTQNLGFDELEKEGIIDYDNAKDAINHKF